MFLNAAGSKWNSLSTENRAEYEHPVSNLPGDLSEFSDLYKVYCILFVSDLGYYLTWITFYFADYLSTLFLVFNLDISFVSLPNLDAISFTCQLSFLI